MPNKINTRQVHMYERLEFVDTKDAVVGIMCVIKNKLITCNT